jgi:hypothetical protein
MRRERMGEFMPKQVVATIFFESKKANLVN